MIRRIISFILFFLLSGIPLALRAEGTGSKTGENFSCPFILGTFSSEFNTSHKVDNIKSYDLDYPELSSDKYYNADVVHQFAITQTMEITLDNGGTFMDYYAAFRTTLMSSLTDSITEADFDPHYSGIYLKRRYELDAGTYYLLTRHREYYVLDQSTVTVNLKGIPLHAGANFRRPIDAGKYSSDFTYTDVCDTHDYIRSNLKDKPGKEVVYKLVVGELMRLDIDNFGSNVEDTYLSVYSVDNKRLYSSDSNHSQNGLYPNIAELNIPVLYPGTYFVVADGNVDGDIHTNIHGYALGVEGDRLVTAIDAGRHEGGFLYSDMRDTSFGFTNQFDGKPANDVFYRLTLNNSADLQVSHCGSVIADTHLSILDAAGSVLYSNDNYTGPDQCGNSGNAFLHISNLAAGTYYIVSEGNTGNGMITTTIESRETTGGLSTTIGQPHVISYIPTAACENLLSAETDSARQEIQYYDYFGNANVKVQRGFSPYGSDLYTLQEYDGIGRESNLWLPVVKSNTHGAYVYPQHLKDAARKFYPYGEDADPYNRPIYDGSPLNVIIEQYGPGKDWHTKGHSVKTDRITNFNPADTTRMGQIKIKLPHFIVKYYRLSGDTLLNDGYYGTGKLDVTSTTDEDGNVSYLFTDHNGRTVLTRQIAEGEQMHDTYTLYDGYGNIRLVLPPMAVDGLEAIPVSSSPTTWNEDNPILKKYAYIYHYDSCNRCIYKKHPGCEPVYAVYDGADRAIFTQSGNQRLTGEWTFTFPDEFNRTVVTGTCMNTLDYASNPLGEQIVKATRVDTTNALKGYAVSGVVLDSPTVLSASYYDTYDFLGFNGIPAGSTTAYTEASGYGTRYAGGSKGQQTGRWIAQPGHPTSDGVYSVMYYDQRYRMIQQKGNNFLNGTEESYIAYNFEGSPTAEKHVRTVPGKETMTETRLNTYDSANRLLQTGYQLNDAPSVVLVDNVYDEIGRLKVEKRNGQPNLRSDYNYNVRSWTKSINGPLFSQTLNYQEEMAEGLEGVVGNIPRYNGNISNMFWAAGQSTGGRIRQGYHFTYDALGRLKDAIYGEGAKLTLNPNRFNEQVVEYDKMGNILGLLRYGQTSPSDYDLIDNLNLNYDGNQLQSVRDKATDTVLGNGIEFKDGANQVLEYSYDKNGNLTKDLNKKITDIQYNILNLPMRITFEDGNSVEYVYDADGTKLRSLHHSPAGSRITDYCGNAIYENGELKMLLNEAGYYSFHDKKFHFYLTDHQGNIRVVADEDGNVEESNDYYPFGGLMSASSLQSVQPYKYNGKELDRENGLDWYDYGARHYDAALGRFMMTDPMAEKYYSISTYVYVANNPLSYVDLKGDSISVANLYARDKQSKLINPNQVEAFEFLANTKEGKALLANYAAKGQTIAGVSFNKDGKFHRQGVNLSFGTGVRDRSVSGTTTFSLDDENLNIQVVVGNSSDTSDLLDTFIHEIAIHADQNSVDFSDDTKMNNSNAYPALKKMNGSRGYTQHWQERNVNRAMERIGVPIIQQYYRAKGVSKPKGAILKSVYGFVN